MSNRLRNERIEIRVSPIEKEMIRQRMERCHVTNVGRYMRRMAIDGCIFNVDYTPIDHMNYELNKIGTNINQIACKVNQTGSIYEADIKNLNEAMKSIWQLLKVNLLGDS